MPGQLNNRSKKTTQRQFEMMVDFMSNHRELENRKFTPSFTQKDKDELWRQLTNLLNADGYGPIKKPEKWRKTWIDYKSEIKGKYAEIVKERKKTGNLGKEHAPIPPLYEKVLSLIDNVLITGDDDVPETGRNEEMNFMEDTHETTAEIYIDDDDDHPNESNASESFASISNLTDTPSSTFMQARKHKKINNTENQRQPGVSRKNFSSLVETEAEKTAALRELSAAVERGNALKEKELELMEKKNDIKQQSNQIFATFNDNIVNLAQQFLAMHKK